MPQVPIFIKKAHIACIIPSMPDTHGCLFKIIKVTLHYNISLDQDSTNLTKPAISSSLIILYSDLHARQYLADASRPAVARSICGDHRRCLGGPITFVKSDSMFFLKFLL